ncbi:MAG: hypothetical protein CVT59_05660 [Actinobacteria bacterium HGW-Actinobacteria-1]|jgi:hypothetical protein|nr:MAG: hypothetical protein CVT59_05660 [Actinobacteria bacterium HGW-Actinobacteria-1]
MRTEDLRRYIKNTEKMVVPAMVATTTQGSAFLRKLPLRLQRYIADRGARSNPYMSFVVEPYAVFLAFEITDTEAASKILPPGYSLFPSAMFTDTSARPCAIVSAFNVHTNVFWGSRVEFYLIAENCNTGLLSWVIVEYESNTHSYEPSRGFIAPSTKPSVVTTSYAGEIIIDVASAECGNSLAFVADLNHAVSTELDQRLWVEGNLSVDYGGALQQCTKPFSLVFDPQEMARALKLPLEDISLCTNTFGAGMLDPRPFEAACFPYAQHFVTTSTPTATTMRTAEDLERAVSELNKTLNAPKA